MANHLKICPTCKKEKIQGKFYKNGYIDCYEDTATECPYGHPIIMTSMLDDDFTILEKISDSTDFYDAMIKLHDEDIIEYELKMSQFRSQVEQINDIKQQSNIPHCPTCDSTNIEKISLTKKAAGAFGFGLFSKTAKSQFHCKDCGYKW